MMNKLHKLLMTTTVIIFFSGIPFGETLVQAQEAAYLQCIKEYTNLGISADAALAECQKTSLAECVQRLITQKYVAKSVSESNGRYLIDLGASETTWLEGNGWRSKKCSPNTEGASKKQTQQFVSGTSTETVLYEWFRQGWCKEPQIDLGQSYSVDEAKTICELGLQPKE